MNDAALLERWVKRRDADAFNEIVTRFADQVYGTCRNILRNDADAEEVAQECFLLLVRSGDDVRVSLGGWLHRAATTKSLDRIRGEARRREHERAHVETAARHAESGWDDIQEHVDAAIDTLPEDLREAVVAHFVGRRSHAEIARDLRLTRRAVSYRIQRGVEALRADLVRRGVSVSCVGLGALLLAQAAPAAPLSLKASLGKLALAAGLPAGTGAGAATAAGAAGSLILMKAKLIVAAVVVCAAAGIYFATRPEAPEPAASDFTQREEEFTPVPAGQVEATQPDGAVELVPASAPIDTAENSDDAEEHRGTVMGVVLLPTGQPAQGAIVRYTWKANPYEPPVRGLKSHAPQSARTDAKGSFVFSRVPRGRASIAALHREGVATESVTVESRGLTHDLTLVLQGGERITGQVVSRDGAPIAGARVVPMARDGKGIRDHEREGRTVITDADGGFEVPHLKAGEWTFRASAEDFGMEVTEPIATGATSARIILAPGADLACRVVDAATRKPIAGVEVTLKYADERTPLMTAQSDAEGHAVLESLGKGSYTLDVTHERYALDGPPLPVGIDPARKTAPLILELVEGGKIQGRVFDTTTGNGIPDIVVRASTGATGRSFNAAPTAEDGRYTLAGLTTDDYRLYTRKLPPIYSRELPNAPQTVAVTHGQTVDAVDIPLSPGAFLGGIVLDAGGNPVAGAEVLVKPENSGGVLGNLYTQEDGRFAVGDFAAGESIVLSAHSRVGESGLMGPYTAGEPSGAEIEVTLSRKRTGMITGRVTDPQGRPYLCQLQARADDPELQFPVMGPLGETDGLGNFVLAGACEGTYIIEIVPERTARQKSAPIRVEEGQVVSGVNLVYDEGQLFELAGVVLDENENPVAGVRVSARGQFSGSIPSETTDEKGVFHFRDIPRGRYSLEPAYEGYDNLQSMSLAEAGDMNVVIQLLQTSGVSGQVTNAQGNPVSNFLIYLIPISENIPLEPRFQRRFSDPDGMFSMDCPANNVWILRVESEGYVTADVELGGSRIGRDITEVSVVLQAAP